MNCITLILLSLTTCTTPKAWGYKLYRYIKFGTKEIFKQEGEDISNASLGDVSDNNDLILFCGLPLIFSRNNVEPR